MAPERRGNEDLLISVGDKDDNISIIEMRKCKMLKNIKFPFEVNEMA